MEMLKIGNTILDDPSTDIFCFQGTLAFADKFEYTNLSVPTERNGIRSCSSPVPPTDPRLPKALWLFLVLSHHG